VNKYSLSYSLSDIFIHCIIIYIIVKKFEEQGYYFISMKLKYSYIKTNDSFIIDTNFKGSTDGIKIDIVKTYEMDENDRELINVLPT